MAPSRLVPLIIATALFMENTDSTVIAQAAAIVRLDLPNRRLDMLVAEDELARRRAAWTPPAPRFERGWGWMYTHHVTQADKGCDFDFLERDFGAAAGEPDIF